MTSSVKDCKSFDLLFSQKAGGMSTEDLTKKAAESVKGLKEAHLLYMLTQPIEDISDEKLISFKRYTDGLPLKLFENALHLVPSLVNLVSLADAIPLDGSSLPFDLRKIAVRCKNAVYFAPRRFTAVQLAFDQPRSRVLLFHTGRMVGTGELESKIHLPIPCGTLSLPCFPAKTGCDGPMAAKLAVVRALKSISEEAGVHIGVRRFAVINQVGAVAMEAKLDCDSFADAHSSDSHFDKQSFVGLAWRPQGESICAEAYSTGKCNLPGSRRKRDLLKSWARMVPELYLYSDRPEMADKFDTTLRGVHQKRLELEKQYSASSKKQKQTISWETEDAPDNEFDFFDTEDATGGLLDDLF